MKEREFKKLVFENFVQAKKELIREGYLKRTDNLNFEDVFNETKKKVLEERVKSLQRENEMLKSKLSQRRDLQEDGEDGSKLGAKFQQGSKALDGLFDFIDRVRAKYGDIDSKISVIKSEMKARGIIESDRDLNQFGMKLKFKIEKERLSMKTAIFSSLREMGIRTPETQTLSESRRRRLQKEGLFDMFGKKQQPQTQQREPRQVWLEGLVKVFGSELKADFNKMDDRTLENFYKPINNLFIEGGTESFWGGLKGILERTDGVNFKDLNQQYFLSISKELMLLKQLRNLFTIIETNPLLNGKRRFASDALWLYTNNNNRLAADGLDMVYRKSKAYNQPMSKILDLINTYATPSPQNLAENKKRRY